MSGIQPEHEQTLECLYPKTSLAVWLVVILGLGSSMALYFGPGLWFENLTKPTWNPPSWVLVPVWMLSYALMAISAWLIRRDNVAPRSEVLSAMGL
ncbi:MAG: tryptophan-rich sensory protein, partial [Arenimonas sp.]